jgi:hypothetical protein
MDARGGYPYEREPGYYLMSIWAINYGAGSLSASRSTVWNGSSICPVERLLVAVLAPVFLLVSSSRDTRKHCSSH